MTLKNTYSTHTALYKTKMAFVSYVVDFSFFCYWQLCASSLFFFSNILAQTKVWIEQSKYGCFIFACCLKIN